MAVQKKKPTKIKFELSPSGIIGIGVVCFCIFLWMFLIGVWAGQSLLYGPDKSARVMAHKKIETKQKTIPLLSPDKVKQKMLLPE